MTARMADSITPANLPDGMDAYLGYVNGSWPDWQAIKARFPGKPVYGLSAFGAHPVDPGEAGVDEEPGDYDIPGAVAQIKRELAAGVDRPIGYCPASQANALLDEAVAEGLGRTQWRLLTAHYAIRNGQPWEHICGPATCGLVREPADGTQWVDHGPWDESLLDDTFITAASHPGPAPVPALKPIPSPPQPEEEPMPPAIFVAKQATGPGVYVINQLLAQRMWIPDPADAAGFEKVYGPAVPLTDASLKQYTPVGQPGPVLP